MYKFNSKIVKKLLNVSEDFRVPDALMALMFDRNKREETFKKFLDIDRDVSYDWFHEYFQTEQAERKSKKQDFTPNSVAEIMNRLVGKSDEYFEPAAGTGGIAIKHWHEDLINNHNPFTYSPHLDFMVLEEQSERALPFLLFNLSIRGINAIVIHGDSLTREINNIYYVLNDKDDFLAFSTINVMPQSKMIASEFDVREWTADPINYIEADTKLWAVNVMKENKIIAKFIKLYEQINQGDK